MSTNSLECSAEHALAALSAVLVEEDGQDVVEYALLTAFIGLAGLAAWGAIEDALGAAYAGFDTNTQDLWEPPPPQAPPPPPVTGP